MNKIIRFELEYIPKGSKGSNQNKLRFYYNAYRRRGMAKGKSREECLKDAINRLREDHPNFNPKFDKKFFTVPENMPAQVHKKGFFQRLLDRIKT
jgi:hypothetical protein